MEVSVEELPEQKLRKFPGAVPFILIICSIERYAANSIVGKIVANLIKTWRINFVLNFFKQFWFYI